MHRPVSSASPDLPPPGELLSPSHGDSDNGFQVCVLPAIIIDLPVDIYSAHIVSWRGIMSTELSASVARFIEEADAGVIATFAS